MQTLDEQITEYLTLGGMFNPELMNHIKVRDIILQCREKLQEQQEEITRLKTKA